MNHKGTKTLETERLVLRRNKEEDLLSVFNVLKDDNIRRWYATCRMGENLEKDLCYLSKQLKKYRNLDFYRWSIIRKRDNKFLGMINIIEKEGYVGDVKDIGWYITKEEQEKGYAYEAVREVLKYLFEEIQLGAIETSAAINNPALFKLMEKLGMKKRNSEPKPFTCYYGDDTLINEYGITINEYREIIAQHK